MCALPRRVARLPDVCRLRHPRRQALPRTDCRGGQRQDAGELLRFLCSAPWRLRGTGYRRSRALATGARETIRQETLTACLTARGHARSRTAAAAGLADRAAIG